MNVIEVKDLVKKFGKLAAVDGVTFSVKSGEIFGFLGPNGAGKTTTINMLCTLLKPTSGKATLNGFDVAAYPNQVRSSIGLVFQDTTLDERLTARENLEFHALIYNIGKKVASERIREVLRMVELEGRQNDLVKKFSGGMKRRLEIARGLLHYPKVLFLDEPTLGLDPQTRNYIWSYIHELKVKEKITIFLTTHYMDEAENCDRIAIIDYGKIVAMDTPSNLKKQVGGDVVLLKTSDDKKALEEMKKRFGIEATLQDDSIRFEVESGEEFIPKLASGLLSLKITSISLRRPTLEDVFLKLTGRVIREEKVGAVDRMREHVRGRRR